jgi:hypothetical protein
VSPNRRHYDRRVTDFLAWLGVVLTPYAWATHILLGLAMQVVAALILRRAGVRNAWWIAAALSIGFWWGRKKIEYEFALAAAAHLGTEGPFWYLGWLPPEWPWPRQLEFYAPAAANIVAALAFNRPRSSRPTP